MGRGSARPRPLALDPTLDQALHALLDAAIPWILERSAPLAPRLLLLMGSAAVGEASGVRWGEGFLPLSDLDIALVTERAGPPAWQPESRRALREKFAAHTEALGLSHNPLDVGLFPLPAFERMPLTLEIAEALAHGIPLWGERACLASRRSERPSAFEPLRLLSNRIRETLLPGEGRSWLRFDPPAAPAWATAPEPTAWQEAHRWAKLVIDAGKACLAAEGCLEPSVAARQRRLSRAGEPQTPAGGREPAGEEASCGRLDRSAREQIEGWSRWRLAPEWPPPAVDLGAIASLARALLAGPAGAHPGPGEGRVSRQAWRSVLAREGGAARERLRSWMRLGRARPAEVRTAEGLRLALTWGWRAWPRSLATWALLQAWLAAIEARGGADRQGPAVRRLLRAEIPPCRGAALGSWDASWNEAFRDWFAWLAAAGL